MSRKSTSSSNKINITKQDIIWSYIAQFFNMGVNIIILPVILKMLPSNVLGIWYVFLTIGSFAVLLDFGFQPTFTRNVAFLFSGATSLQKEGIDSSQPLLDIPNYALLKTLIKAMKKFYGYSSSVMLFILLVFGSLYVNHLSSDLQEYKSIMISWVIYAIGTSFSFFYYYFNSLLLGRGLVKENNLLIIISKSVYMITAVLGMLLGYGIISMAFATCLSIVVNRIFAVYFFYKGGLKARLETANLEDKNVSLLMRIVSYNATKVGFANLAIFFTTKGNLFFVSWFLPLTIVGQYGLTIQIITFVCSMSMLYFQAHIPLVAKYRVEKDIPSIAKVFGESLVIMAILYFIVAVILFFFGNYILTFIGSKTLLLSGLPLFLLLLIYFLDTNHAIALNLLITKNTIPYLIAALVSGFSIGILSPIFMGVFHWGIYGAIIATGIVQLFYHNWKWPIEAGKDLQEKYFHLWSIGGISLQRKIIKNKLN